MYKQGQVLIIEPQNELKFVGPFNQPVSSYMKLSNPSDKKVMFKIKTTAPKKYCVRPNSGVLQAGENTQIAICLQPFLYDPAERNKHKFMVQTAFAPENDLIPWETIWKELAPDQLMDSKLRCVFEIPAQDQSQNATVSDMQTDGVHNDSNEVPKNQDIHSGGDSIELQRATKEIHRLREVESELRQEILRLKEEKLEWKNQKGLAAPNRYAPPVDQPMNVYIIAIAIVVGLTGILFGKFLL
ncbi:hypothetical protein ABEB36_001349 [Hypothenemus hampei]|uniref:MSP domain-containing protein n=1 Tax=Hypothenemus hampei TaxID=57062 RepID=A0ABD1FHU5_HYPHA